MCYYFPIKALVLFHPKSPMVFLIWQVQEMEQILQKVGEDVLPGVSMSTAQLWLYWDWYEFYMLSQMFDKNLLYEICRHYLGHNNIENDDMKDLSQIQKSPIFNFCHLSCFENFSFLQFTTCYTLGSLVSITSCISVHAFAYRLLIILILLTYTRVFSIVTPSIRIDAQQWKSCCLLWCRFI
jgi:hypothetical protein